MATCGYICPKCEGTGFIETLEKCDWCNIPSKIKYEDPLPLSDEEWLEQVHNRNCCSDIAAIDNEHGSN